LPKTIIVAARQGSQGASLYMVREEILKVLFWK